MTEDKKIVLLTALGLGGFVLYVLPSLVAYYRDHRKTNTILVLNVLFGWTLIGWVVSVAWSMTDNTCRYGA